MTTTELLRSTLGRRDYLAKGGTALIYRVPNLDLGVGPLVYKEYKKGFRERAGMPAFTAGLRRFVRFRDKLAPEQRARWDERIVWPIAVVMDESSEFAMGVVMPVIPARYFHAFPKRVGGHDTKPREIETLFGAPEEMTGWAMPPLDIAGRLRLIAGIAQAYGLMHKMSVVVGDVSGRNLVYDPINAPPNVLVVDVDGARLEGTRAISGTQAHTPHWEPPEALAAERSMRQARRSGIGQDDLRRLANAWSIQSKQTDVYKFGLMVTRILDPGRQRAVNRDPTRAVAVLQQQGHLQAAALLVQSLDSTKDERPTMREWHDALRERRGPTGESPATGIAGKQRTASHRTGIPDGMRKGNWTWVEGTGWVRTPMPAPGGEFRKRRLN